MLIGIFAKFPDLEPVKTRLQSQLSVGDAAAFHLAALADVLETACLVVPHPVLFLSRGAETPATVRDALLASGLDPAAWAALHLHAQQGADLGARLERAFGVLCGAAAATPALILGSDSPSLPAAMLRTGLEQLARADAVLGPTADGGYWCIGVRAPRAGLLADIPWSASNTFEATCTRFEQLGLSLALLPAWTDVDTPGDLAVLAAQVAACRTAGDPRTARHSERVLRALGIPLPGAAPPDGH